MDPDCDAEKAAKAAATKAVVGVGGRCTPKEALKDTAVDAGKDKLPDEGMAGKAVDAMTPEKEKKTVKRRDKKSSIKINVYTIEFERRKHVAEIN
ncbi:hypothetical protein JCM19053_3611 [Vibrio sp. JCM 19053]|nr:hypothetical protein JCM19053_3611 [Vibrio sp. JCM 19053]